MLNVPEAEIGEIWKVVFDSCIFLRSVLLPDSRREIGGFTMVYRFSLFGYHDACQIPVEKHQGQRVAVVYDGCLCLLLSLQCHLSFLILDGQSRSVCVRVSPFLLKRESEQTCTHRCVHKHMNNNTWHHQYDIQLC